MLSVTATRRVGPSGPAAAVTPSLLLATAAGFAPVVTAAGWPDASSTGVPAGVTLTASGGVSSSADGQVIDALDITGGVEITHKNVTVKRCRITVSQSDGYAVLVKGTGVTIEDVEVAGGSGTSGSYDGIAFQSGGNGLVQRVNVHHFENCFGFSGGNVTIKDSYLHDLYATYSGADPHYDAIECLGGSHYLVQGCYIDNPHTQTSAVNFTAYESTTDDVQIIGNYLAGGGYAIYLDNRPNGISNAVVDDNTFAGSSVGPLAAYSSTFAHAPQGNTDGDGNPVSLP